VIGADVFFSFFVIYLSCVCVVNHSCIGIVVHCSLLLFYVAVVVLW